MTPNVDVVMRQRTRTLHKAYYRKPCIVIDQDLLDNVNLVVNGRLMSKKLHCTQMCNRSVLYAWVVLIFILKCTISGFSMFIANRQQVTSVLTVLINLSSASHIVTYRTRLI